MYLNEGDYQGNTPLHCAARCGRHQAVLWLLSVGANVNAASMFGRTPLDNAEDPTSPGAAAARRKIAELLARRGGVTTGTSTPAVLRADDPDPNRLAYFVAYYKLPPPSTWKDGVCVLRPERTFDATSGNV